MPTHDSSHFDEYTPQNHVKHLIFQNYLHRYMLVLKNHVEWFHYIDGFAGCGRYEDQHDGSPILALATIEELALLERTAISLVEEKASHFHQLAALIAESPAAKRLRFAPFLERGTFAQLFPQILSHAVYTQPGRVATFAFIDPCGVDGVRMKDLAQLLEQPYGEVLLFFNYDGLNRVAGAHAVGSVDDTILQQLFGAPPHVAAFKSGLACCKTSSDREVFIRESFRNALRAQTRARFVLPFRFSCSDSDRPSHYLIHCCSHELGFKLMKDVMSSAGREPNQKIGMLEFPSESKRGDWVLFRPEVVEQKQRILERLAEGPCMVRLLRKSGSGRLMTHSRRQTTGA